MASNALRTTSFLLTLNLLFFTLVSSQTSPAPATCSSSDSLQFGVCAGFLNNLLGGIVVGAPPTIPCCNLFLGLVEFEAAACLCQAFKINLLGVNLDIPASLSLVLNNCGKEVPSGFKCE